MWGRAFGNNRIFLGGIETRIIKKVRATALAHTLLRFVKVEK